MKRSKIILSFILVPLWLGAGSRAVLAQESEVDQLIREFKGEEEPGKRTPQELEAAYARVIESLLPKMGSDDLEEQKSSQQTFQEICWRAGRPGAEVERAAVCRAIAARLSADPPAGGQAARVWLLKQLEYIGGGEVVGALSGLLKDQDHLIRDRALRALENNPSPEAASSLHSALEKAESADWRIALINALGYRGDKAGAPLLIKEAGSDDESVRCAAMEALARMGDKAAADVIAAGMSKDSQRARDVAADSYLVLAHVLCRGDDKEAALEMFRKLLGSEGRLRCAAIIGLAQAGGIQELPAITDALADNDTKVKGAAMSALQTMPGTEVTQALTEKVESAPPEVKAMLLRVLGERGDKAAMPAFLDAAKAPDEEVRIAACEGMGKLADERASDILVEALVKTEGKERETAAAALDRIPGEGVVNAIIEGLSKADPKGRVELVKTLATRRSEKVLPTLLKTAEDPDASVQVESFKALSSLADEKALPALVGLLTRTTEEKAQKEAEKAAAATCRRLGQAEPVLAAYSGASPSVRCSLLRVLGKVGGMEPLYRVCSALADENADIQDAAVRALADWPDAESADALLDIARRSSNETHRVLALRGYVRVVGLPSERPMEQTLKMYEEGMSAARRPEEKKLVLAGLAEAKDLGALALARPYLADDALGAEAATAMIKIAQAVSIEHRQEAEAALREVADSCKDENVQKEVKAAFKRVEQYDDHITAWLVSKSYTEKKKKYKQLFDIAFDPEKPDAANVKWTPVVGGQDPATAWKVDLDKRDKGKERVAYLRSWFRSDKAQKARLETGSDDGLKVWLNGEVVVSKNVNRGVAPSADKVEVNLKEGWNSLLLKVTQGSGYWAACARVRAADGGKLPGVLLMGDPKALEAAAADLTDNQRKAQAAEILVNMAGALSSCYPEETRAALRQAVEISDDESVRKQLTEMLDEGTKYEDYITAWQVSGPYVQEDSGTEPLFSAVFPPEKADHEGAQWAPMPAGADASKPWLMDLEKVIGGTNRAAYLRTYVLSPKKQEAQLQVGSDDGVKVWLNGNVVHANNVGRPVKPGEDRVKVTLDQGWNSLLLKITQGGGHWSACARFRDVNGLHLDGLKFQAETPEGVKFVPVQAKELPEETGAKPAQAPKAAPRKPKAKPKAAQEKPPPMPTEEDIEKITAAMPEKARVQPAKPRKLLVFSATSGHHHGVIPWGNKALEIMGQKTGAFEAVVSDDLANFEPDQIQQFDAICMNNTTGSFFLPKDIKQLPEDQQQALRERDARLKKSLLDFVAGGKGIVGIHSATDAQYDWPEYGEMLGGYFWGHPWNETVTVKIDDPQHPLTAVFEGKSFEVADEIYQFKDPYSRAKLRELLSIDTTKTNMDKGEKIHRTDGDFAVSWVKSYGKGRVFYCSLGHKNEIFWNPAVLQYYLDGIQFALGDLPVDTAPTAEGGDEVAPVQAPAP